MTSRHSGDGRIDGEATFKILTKSPTWVASLEKFDRAWGSKTIKLTRRTLLVGTSVLMVAGTISFRALVASRTYHALLVGAGKAQAGLGTAQKPKAP